MARNPAQVKRRVRKGIPNALRSMAWQLLSGSRDLLLQNPGDARGAGKCFLGDCVKQGSQS